MAEVKWEVNENDFDDNDVLEEPSTSKSEPEVKASPNHPSQAQLLCLSTRFGHKQFRTEQWSAVHSVLQGTDQLVLMGTGYGKSVCYQYPPVLLNKCSLVVCPLISLMFDQMHKLKSLGISSAVLSGTQNSEANMDNLLNSGLLRVLYTTPEYITTQNGKLLCKKLAASGQLCLLAVDEAHCISEWGHDFRKAYRGLGALRAVVPNIPFVALTACASVRVCADIQHNLHMVQPNVTVAGLDRPNLKLSVIGKSSSIADDVQPWLSTIDGSLQFGGVCIVYCPTKAITDTVHQQLTTMGVCAGKYHAGMSDSDRKLAHSQFLCGHVSTMVATVAFGLGIDKADIRTIVHYGAPKDIESYYQEIGRGGRDGKPTQCVMFYSEKDFSLSRQFVNALHQEETRAYRLKMLHELHDLCVTKRCRRKVLLDHFGQSVDVVRANCCDNCSYKATPCNTSSNAKAQTKDYSIQVLQLLDVMYRVCGERFGMNKYIDVLRGTNANTNSKWTCDRAFGCGKKYSVQYWRALGQLLVAEGFIATRATEIKYMFLLVLTKQGRDWLLTAHKQPLIFKATQALLSAESEQGTNAPKQCSFKHATLQHVMNKPINLLPQLALHFFLYSCRLSARKWRVWQDSEFYTMYGNGETPLEQELYMRLCSVLSEWRQEQASTSSQCCISERMLVTVADTRPTQMDTLTHILTVSCPQSLATSIMQAMDTFCVHNALQRDVMNTDQNRKLARAFQMLPASVMCLVDDLPSHTRSVYQQIVLDGSPVNALSEPESTVHAALCSCVRVGLPLHLTEHCHLQQPELVLARLEYCIRSLHNNDTSNVEAILTSFRKDSPEVALIEQWQLQILLNILQFEFCAPFNPLAVKKEVGSEPERVLPDWMGKATNVQSNTSVRPPPTKRKKSSLFGKK